MLRSAWVRRVLGAGLLLVIGGCGGGGVESITLEIVSSAALDGWVQSDGGFEANGSGPVVGDLDMVNPGVGYREFFSFDLSAIPLGAAIDAASLHLHQQAVTGTPYATHGVVVVDHLDYGASLDGGDYALAALTPGIGVLSSDATIGVKVLGVTSSVRSDVSAGRPRAQFRVRFSTTNSDNDGILDFVQFTDAENSISGAGMLPRLFVTYTP